MFFSIAGLAYANSFSAIYNFLFDYSSLLLLLFKTLLFFSISSFNSFTFFSSWSDFSVCLNNYSLIINNPLLNSLMIALFFSISDLWSSSLWSKSLILWSPNWWWSSLCFTWGFYFLLLSLSRLRTVDDKLFFFRFLTSLKTENDIFRILLLINRIFITHRTFSLIYSSDIICIITNKLSTAKWNFVDLKQHHKFINTLRSLSLKYVKF